jgi:hypothetical protein
VGHHLRSGEGEGLEEVDLGHEPQHASLLQNREGVEVLFREQGFEIAQRYLARYGLHVARHVLIRCAFEKAISWAASTIAAWHGLLLSA